MNKYEATSNSFRISIWQGIPCDFSYTSIKEGIRQFKEDFPYLSAAGIKLTLLCNDYYKDAANTFDLDLIIETTPCLKREAFILLSNLDQGYMFLGPKPID